MKRLQFTGDEDIDRARYEDMRAIWAAEDSEMAVRNARLDAVIATRLYPQGYDPLFPDGDASPNLWQRQIDQEAWG